uniref:CACTA en-spm transposon protein n=1 Tax=Cucumis melo TaxID=3656 RepID=A0A9I9EG05_CUCME
MCYNTWFTKSCPSSPILYRDWKASQNKAFFMLITKACNCEVIYIEIDLNQEDNMPFSQSLGKIGEECVLKLLEARMIEFKTSGTKAFPDAQFYTSSKRTILDANMLRRESLVVIYNELITVGMYPRRFALCVGDGVGNKDHSQRRNGVLGKILNSRRYKWDLLTTEKNERGMKGRDELLLPCVLSLCPIAFSLATVALAAVHPCRRLPPCIKLERHVAVNGRISMTIVPGAEKPIFPHIVRFSQAIDVCVRKTFLVRFLKWANVGREYIEVVKGDLQRFFVLDFNDQAMNRFVEHQMLTTFKKFRGDCHRHFKRYSDSEEDQTSNHERKRLLDRSSLTIIAAGQSRFYNDSMSLLRKKGSQSTHNQMLELQSQPTLEGSQLLSGDEICNQVLGR